MRFTVYDTIFAEFHIALFRDVENNYELANEFTSSSHTLIVLRTFVFEFPTAFV